jgi:hypothetical protein
MLNAGRCHCHITSRRCSRLSPDHRQCTLRYNFMQAPCSCHSQTDTSCRRRTTPGCSIPGTVAPGGTPTATWVSEGVTITPGTTQTTGTKVPVSASYVINGVPQAGKTMTFTARCFFTAVHSWKCTTLRYTVVGGATVELKAAVGST